jgi:flagellar biosynthesis protein FlhG
MTSPYSFSDQARTLREMIERRANIAESPSIRRQGGTLAVVGKGGVGKSVVALNLAVSLAQQGRSVCLLDAHLGLGSLDVMCGKNGYWNLSHVISGARRLGDVLLEGPQRITLVPGADSLGQLAAAPPAVQAAVLGELQELEGRHDVLIVDTGGSLQGGARRFALAADQLLVVTTPEPTAITEAYATIKSLCGAGVDFGLVVNLAESTETAIRIAERLKHTSRMFLQADVETWGVVPRDPAVPQSVWARTPLMCLSPGSPAAKALGRLAQRCLLRSVAAEPFFRRLFPPLSRAA